MNEVWILEQGEACEGGAILGVYASKEAGRPDFEKAARQIDRSFGISHADMDEEDGSIVLRGGCDILTLAPYPVHGAPAQAPTNQLESGQRAITGAAE